MTLRSVNYYDGSEVDIRGMHTPVHKLLETINSRYSQLEEFDDK